MVEGSWSIFVRTSASDQVRAISVSISEAAPVHVDAPKIVEELKKNVALLEQVSQDAGHVVGQISANGLVEEMSDWELSAIVAPNGRKEEDSLASSTTRTAGGARFLVGDTGS